MNKNPEQELTQLLEQCFDLATSPTVRSFEESGTLGYFPVYFPEEIAHAGGLIPQALLGGGNMLEVRHADARIGSFVCSICRSTTEMGMNGSLSSLSAFFTQPICDVAKHMAGIWNRNFPNQSGQILDIPQNILGKGSVQYLHDEYQRLRQHIESLVHHAISDDDLRRSLEVYNRNRRLIRELYQIKASDPGRLSTTETYLLVRAGTRMRKEEHNDILSQALELIKLRSPLSQDKPRVCLLGGFCEQPPLAMLEAIEDASTIVDDDLLIGQRWFTEDVPIGADPLWSLADSYVHRTLSSPVQHSGVFKEDALKTILDQSQAEAVILTAAKFCEPGLDDQWSLGKYLKEHKIPHLILEFEEKMNSFEQMAMQIETFSESLMFLAN